MSFCLAVGTLMLTLMSPDFTLRWTHSVERIGWEEDWRVEGDALTLVRSRIKGSGAGMEPGPDAVLRDGWWVSDGHLRLPSLTLAASGATAGGWELCADDECRSLGTESGPPIRIAPCDTGEGQQG